MVSAIRLCWRPCRASRWRSWEDAHRQQHRCLSAAGGGGADPGGLAGRCEPSDRPGLHPGCTVKQLGQRTGARLYFRPLAREQAEFPAAWAGTSGALLAGAPVLAGYLDGTPVGAVAFDDGRESERAAAGSPAGSGRALAAQGLRRAPDRPGSDALSPHGPGPPVAAHAGDGGCGGLLPGVRLFSGGGRAGVGKFIGYDPEFLGT